jgi:hypothetical protein
VVPDRSDSRELATSGMACSVAWFSVNSSRLTVSWQGLGRAKRWLAALLTLAAYRQLRCHRGKMRFHMEV